MFARFLCGLFLSWLVLSVTVAQSMESPSESFLDADRFHRPAGWEEQRKEDRLMVASPEQDQWYEVWEIRGFSDPDGVKTYIDTFFSVLYGQYQKREVAPARAGRGPVFQGNGLREGLKELFQYCILQPEEKLFLLLLSRSDGDRPPLDIIEILRENGKP